MESPPPPPPPPPQPPPPPPTSRPPPFDAPSATGSLAARYKPIWRLLLISNLALGGQFASLFLLLSALSNPNSCLGLLIAFDLGRSLWFPVSHIRSVAMSKFRSFHTLRGKADLDRRPGVSCSTCLMKCLCDGFSWTDPFICLRCSFTPWKLHLRYEKSLRTITIGQSFRM